MEIQEYNAEIQMGLKNKMLHAPTNGMNERNI